MRPAQFGCARHAGWSAERMVEPVAKALVGGEIPGREIRRPPLSHLKTGRLG